MSNQTNCALRLSHLQHTRIQTHRHAWLVFRKRPPLSVRPTRSTLPVLLLFPSASRWFFSGRSRCAHWQQRIQSIDRTGEKTALPQWKKKRQARYMSSWIFHRTADFTELVFLEIFNLPDAYLVHWFPESDSCRHIEIYYSVNFMSHLPNCQFRRSLH